MNVCWMVRGTDPLAASIEQSLLSFAERGLGTPEIAGVYAVPLTIYKKIHDKA